jgi:uncharacterized membrane protein YozB (DUF420 family)
MNVPLWVSVLPHVNAFLNATSAGLLALGYGHIRARRIPQHKKTMLAAFVVSALFLASYLTYHLYPGVGTVRFVEPVGVRPIYLCVLIPHSILAAIVPPFAIMTLTLALRSRYAKHRRLAIWTLPVWGFVSVTGVIVYLMLYVLFPQPSL